MPNSQMLMYLMTIKGFTNGADTAEDSGEYVSTVSESDSALSGSGVLLNTGHDNDRARK